MEDSRTEFDRMYSILGGLLFEINLVNIYMSRDEYPLDLLSRNKIIKDVVGFIKEVHQEENITISWNRFKDLLSKKLNVPVKNLDNHGDAEAYYTIWEKAEQQYIQERKSPEYINKWKAELKWMVEFYVRSKSKWVSKTSYIMLDQECFGSPCENPCDVVKHCRKCIKQQEKPLKFISDWTHAREQELVDIARDSKGRRSISYGKDVAQRLEKYGQEYEYIQSGNKTLGVSTFIPTVDEMTDGLQIAQVFGVFGRSGVGKSAFCLQIALDIWANTNTNVLFLNLELPILEIQKRMDSALTGVAFSKILKGQWDSREEFDSFKENIEKRMEGKENEFIIMDVFDLDLHSLRAVIKEHHEMWGDGFVVVLDNINRMSLPPNKPQHEALKDIGIAYHKASKEFNTRNVLVGQLNRDAKSVKRIGQGDGNILAGADAIINDLSVAIMLIKYLGNEEIKGIPLKARNFAMDRCVILKNELWKMRMTEIPDDKGSYDHDTNDFTLDDEDDLSF